MFAIGALMIVLGSYIPTMYSSAAPKAIDELQVAEDQTTNNMLNNEPSKKMDSKEHNKNAPSPNLISNKQVMNINATAYAPGPHDNGKWGNLTHIGTQVRPGVIAVDPKVIPLGSKLYIEFADGHGMYGVAEDTGGAIKGNRIDIAMWTIAEAYDFGMQKVKVYVLN